MRELAVNNHRFSNLISNINSHAVHDTSQSGLSQGGVTEWLKV